MINYTTLGIFIFFIGGVYELIGQTIFPTGTTIYKPAEAYSSYILIADHSAIGNHPSTKTRAENAGTFPGDIRLIDMNGNVVHTWEVKPATYTYDLYDEYNPATRARSMARMTGYTCTAGRHIFLFCIF